MRDFNFDNGILHIKVNGYGDELLLDSTDMSIFNRFVEMYDKVQKIADELEVELKRVKEECDAEGETSTAGVTAYINVYIEHIKKIAAEFDGVFGDGFMHKVFRENYELNPNFVPDELSITELLEAIIPIMEDAYGERIKRNKSKYSAAKKGKHTKSKDELITEYKEKNGIE